MIGDGDLEQIFESGDFDTEAVFGTTPTTTVHGWFTDASDEVTMYGTVSIEAAKPSFMCQTADITDVRNKMTAAIDDVTYTVERIERTGTGVSVVYLKT